MEIEALNNDVAKEVLTIILYCDRNIQSKIPSEIIKSLTDLAADSNLEIHLDKNMPLQNQKVSVDALDFFSLLYYTYVADGNEASELLANWAHNDNI